MDGVQELDTRVVDDSSDMVFNGVHGSEPLGNLGYFVGSQRVMECPALLKEGWELILEVECWL